jgi:hypothetical protein
LPLGIKKGLQIFDLSHALFFSVQAASLKGKKRPHYLTLRAESGVEIHTNGFFCSKYPPSVPAPYTHLSVLLCRTFGAQL